uniref:Transmembrane protein 220 n=1 Tax=Cynoglossus semilaevis TaxID=244447 RepID=A0A3P8WX08_CYNSE
MGEVGKMQTWLVFIWRLCNIFMSLFFALATYVQINDPDAGLWMLGYGVPAVLCALIGWKPHVTESLVWRRVADLHVLISSAVIARLCWILYTEQITHTFQECSGLTLTVIWLLLSRNTGRALVGIPTVLTAAAITVFPFVAWIYYYVNKELRSNWPAHCTTVI